MCHLCDSLCETIRIEHPYQYYSIIDQIKTMITNNILELVEGNCDLNQIDRGKPWPNDVHYHVFQCSSCKQKFSLFVQAYQGSGGCWETSI